MDNGWEKKNNMKLSEFLIRFVFVRKCVSCDKILSYEDSESAFCPECVVKWRSAKTETCSVCFKSAVECSCMPKRMSHEGALCLRKLVFYNKDKYGEPQNKIIYFLKRNKNSRAADFIARELSEAIRSELEVLNADKENTVITWVPRGLRAVSLYGFDQACIICMSLEELLDIPAEDIIKRCRGGEEQKHLKRQERVKNITGRFKIDRELSGKNIVLLDDVVTTGASMAECVKLLRKAGAASVICVSIAQD